MATTYHDDGAWTVQAPPAGAILSSLLPGHPRLILDGERLAEIRRLIATDPVAARAYRCVRAEAEALLTAAPSHYEIPDGRRLLSVSRAVKERVRALAFVYRMEGGEQFAARAWEEMAAAAAFPDWNPSHFLDTAEMTHALAIGYDWLYDRLTDTQRRTLCEAIVRLGLTPGLEVYAGRATHNWHTGVNNWNQVCNGGLGIGALAVADVEPEIAGRVLHEALASLPLAMGNYAPDGAGTEGVTYWEYGSRYNILFLSALDTALGTDYGLTRLPGFAESGSYQMYMSGAERMSMDFADCGLRRMSSPQHFWLGRRYGMPEYSWFRYSELAREGAEGNVLDLLWFDDAAKTFDLATLPLDKHFRKAETASMRSSWDEDALIVGVQAGLDSYHGHRHQDVGSIIVDALGERWIADPGRESEVYQAHRHHKERWEFYRIRAEGHNTLVLNPATPGPDQVIGSFSPIARFTSSPESAAAVVDLSEAYAPHARRVERTVAMEERSYLTVTDVVEADAPVDLWWFAHTHAEVRVAPGGRSATLERHGKRMEVTIQEGPAEAALTVMAAEPLPTSPNPPEQSLDPALRKVAIHLPAAGDVRLVVRFAPVWG